VSETVTTGVPALDNFLKGGLPKGFTTLLLAPVGSGGEILAKQFAQGHGKERVLYVTTDESEAEVQRTAVQAKWDFAGVQVVDLQTDFADAMMDAQQRSLDAPRTDAPKRSFDPRDLVEGTSSLDVLRRPGGGKADSPAAKGAANTDYLGKLLEPYGRLRTPDRVVVHSLDFFLNLYPIDQVVSALTALKAANAKQGGLLFLVLAKGAHGGNTERRLELLADCLIELEVTRKGTAFERFFMVKKVKNRTVGIGVSTYEVTADGFQLETLERIV
jgi:KaiC/GvpD/RAD55 family RecA-like ATPase